MMITTTSGQRDLAKGRIATIHPRLHGLYIVYNVPLFARRSGPQSETTDIKNVQIKFFFNVKKRKNVTKIKKRL